MTPSAPTVLCDFDGTITTRDVVRELLSELADPAWTAIEADWEQGRIDGRECLAKQVALIRGGWPAVERVLTTVTLDPTFAGFSAWCASHGIPLVIVSDGLDRVIAWLLAREHLQVSAAWSNRLVVREDGALAIECPYPPREVTCRVGMRKCQVLARVPSPRVVIGDGVSD